MIYRIDFTGCYVHISKDIMEKLIIHKMQGVRWCKNKDTSSHCDESWYKLQKAVSEEEALELVLKEWEKVTGYARDVILCHDCGVHEFDFTVRKILNEQEIKEQEEQKIKEQERRELEAKQNVIKQKILYNKIWRP